MKLIVECSQKLVRLGENLWGKEQKLDKAEPLDVPTMTTEFIKEIGGLPCPQGYIFKDENGNVINATKIVLEKKKKEYPKTYEDFASLVDRMRDAQWAVDMITGEEDIEYIDMLQIVKREAEREVDEYLKKVEECR